MLKALTHTCLPVSVFLSLSPSLSLSRPLVFVCLFLSGAHRLLPAASIPSHFSHTQHTDRMPTRHDTHTRGPVVCPLSCRGERGSSFNRL